MNYQKLTVLLFLLFHMNLIIGQSMDNESSIHEIKLFYTALETNKSPEEIKAMMSNLKFQPITQVSEEDERLTITMNGILQNLWSMTEVSNLKFELNQDNQLVVTGIFSGRHLVECEFTVSRFQHIWVIKRNSMNSLNQITKNRP